MNTTSSPPSMKELAIQWRASAMPKSWLSISNARSILLAAASVQIQDKAEANIPYDPFHCPLFRWCLQWLDVAEGNRPGIDPEVEFHFRIALDPVPLSRKMLATNDSLED